MLASFERTRQAAAVHDAELRATLTAITFFYTTSYYGAGSWALLPPE